MNDITDWVRDRLPPESQVAVIDPIEETLKTSAGGLLSFGAITALWGGKNALAAMMKALNIVFDIEEGRPWWKQQVIAIGLTVLLGLASIAGSTALLLSSAVGSDIAKRIGLGSFWTTTWRWVQFPLIAAVLVLVLATLYWRGPDAKHSFRTMLPGAIATVVLWAIAVVGLSLYFAYFAGYLGGAYGALGGVMAFVFFLYVMSLITLIGGQISAFAANRALPRPAEGVQSVSHSSQIGPGRDSGQERHRLIGVLNGIVGASACGAQCRTALRQCRQPAG